MLSNLLNELITCTSCSFANKEYPPLAPAHLSDHTKIMFIGENPSWQFGQRIPFDTITPSGKALMDYYIIPLKKALKIKETDIWITDLFKCRYPKGIQKSSQQDLIYSNAHTCAMTWLAKEIRLTQPKIIVTLGDKEVYQMFSKIFSLQGMKPFSETAYTAVWIAEYNCHLLLACHPDLAFYNSRKPKASKKWSEIHRKEFVKSIKGIYKL